MRPEKRILQTQGENVVGKECRQQTAIFAGSPPVTYRSEKTFSESHNVEVAQRNSVFFAD